MDIKFYRSVAISRFGISAEFCWRRWRVLNRLYTLNLNVGQLVCLAAQGSSAAWKWHAHFGHLNFWGLRRLADDDMVDGLPHINHFDQVCDSCLASK
jgi:hypothetical protein